jgi:hypothetical protein
MIGSIVGLAGAIVGVGALFVFLGSNNTSGILKSIFDGFTGSLSAAMGRGK